MTAKTIERLQYFVNRVCSIVSTSMNRSFDETLAREHFVIRVNSVDTDGIWGTHPYNEEMVSFFRLDHIISIHEEFELDPSNPEHQAMLKDYEQRTGQKLSGDLKPKPKVQKADPLAVIEQPPPEPQDGDTTFVDIGELEDLAERTRQMFEAADNFKR